jgi:hypothetical protein
MQSSWTERSSHPIEVVGEFRDQALIHNERGPAQHIGDVLVSTHLADLRETCESQGNFATGSISLSPSFGLYLMWGGREEMAVDLVFDL